ncbi:hypothetical protein [Couchioplanes caeruleus]|uniref:hypothetical protein n=1 Tax=Couchioplanes caeruleus TaxID=56438 RepID=UPI001475026D|nr:hypothetical protein [Couchioplanes caeruleus]
MVVHYTIALRLSRAVGDRLYGARMLVNLATQAVYLRLTLDAQVDAIMVGPSPAKTLR